MTISRFRGAGTLIAAAVLAAAAPLSAQDTTAVVQQLSAQDSAAVVQQLSAQDSAAVVQQQRVHMVREGETLWTLAQFYLGDPFLWPEIYRINTLVVEDPHWIFPGEELRLVPPDTVLIPVADSVPQADSLQLPIVGDPELQNQVTEAQPPPPPPSRALPTVFRKRGEETRRGLAVVRNSPPRRPGRLRFYSAGFLTEREEFPWAEVLGAVGQSTLPSLRATSSATVYESVSIQAPENATYQVGDSLVLSRLSRQVADWGRIVVPTAIALVVQVAGREVEARIEMQFERVADGQVALPIEPFRDRRGVVPVPIENGMRGSIIAVRNLHPLAGLLEVVFIDRGRQD
ncbi:MAG: hypothetical protein V3W06_08355, partial [Acidimicrobiia bacterium]